MPSGRCPEVSTPLWGAIESSTTVEVKEVKT